MRDFKIGDCVRIKEKNEFKSWIHWRYPFQMFLGERGIITKVENNGDGKSYGILFRDKKKEKLLASEMIKECYWYPEEISFDCCELSIE